MSLLNYLWLVCFRSATETSLLHVSQLPSTCKTDLGRSAGWPSWHAIHRVCLKMRYLQIYHGWFSLFPLKKTCFSWPFGAQRHMFIVNYGDPAIWHHGRPVFHSSMAMATVFQAKSLWCNQGMTALGRCMLTLGRHMSAGTGGRPCIYIYVCVCCISISISIYIYLSIFLSIHPPIHPYIYLSIDRSIYPYYIYIDTILYLDLVT
jgi:hypothetical protein